MKEELFNALRTLRNEAAHGPMRLDPVTVANRLSLTGVSIPTAELPEIISAISPVLEGDAGHYCVPMLLVEVVAQILEGRSDGAVCDPCAGLGVLMATAREAVHATKAIAFAHNDAEAALGRVLVPDADWLVGGSLELLNSLDIELDVVVSVVPFGVRSDASFSITGLDGETVELRDDIGHVIVAAFALRLSPKGLGVFVVPASFFFSERSVVHTFRRVGLGVEAALALPSGAFAPYTNISTYLILIRKEPLARTFVAQLSNNSNTNLQVLANLKEGNEGGTLELGRFVDSASFTGLDSLRIAQRFEAAERKFDAHALRLGELATSITLGRHAEDFTFSPHDNAIFVPMIGISDVVNSVGELTLKAQNYAQVVIDPTRSQAGFVARFLNSDLGKEVRELSKSGFIPKLNRRTLQEIRVFIPSLPTQRAMLDSEARITNEQNTLLGLQNELGELRRELWSNTYSVHNIDQRLETFSNRLSSSLKQQAAENLDQWFETLPFPLASILRAWQATPTQDFKTKYEHLLHFFEGAAEFLSIILLSAFASNQQLFEPHKHRLTESMQKQNLTFQRPSFGTWKCVVEYLSKQTRVLLSHDEKNGQDAKNHRAICADLFSDSSLSLPESVSRKELLDILSTTNKMRNDWSGHGGVVGQEEAQLRNQQLLIQVQKLREVMADTWTETKLIYALHSRLRRGVFENEVAILTGSNTEFLKETWSMATCLDVERLYLSKRDSGHALQLLPLVQVGPSPQSAKNACYFFNRLEREGARFVSYHFTDKPELTGEFDEATAAIKSLMVS